MRYRYRQGFTDVDFARLMFSGDYYRWAERAFETWQREEGLPWRRMIEELGLGLPSVQTRCHYLAPIGFEEEFDVEIGVRDLTPRGFVTDFELVRAHDGVPAAYGYFVRRFLDMRTLQGRQDLPEEAATVFAAMAAKTRIPSYDERRAAWERERTSPPPATTTTQGAPAWPASSSC